MTICKPVILVFGTMSLKKIVLDLSENSAVAVDHIFIFFKIYFYAGYWRKILFELLFVWKFTWIMRSPIPVLIKGHRIVLNMKLVIKKSFLCTYLDSFGTKKKKYYNGPSLRSVKNRGERFSITAILLVLIIVIRHTDDNAISHIQCYIRNQSFSIMIFLTN